MAGAQKNVRLSRRALELIRALRYVLNVGDNLVIEMALDQAAVAYLTGCAQRLQLAGKGLIPESEVDRLRTEAAVLAAALNTDAGTKWPRYRVQGDVVERQREDGTWVSLAVLELATEQPVPGTQSASGEA